MLALHDETLLRDFGRRRDEASFRRLYRQQTPRLFALALRLSGSQSRAEDLTQETWIRAVQRHDSFSGDSAYSTWLAGILLNCWRESIRRRGGTEETLAEDTPALVAVPPEPVADPIDVEKALSQLPPGFRAVVILHDVNGYTHREIAGLLGIREGTSKSQLQRARARLRTLLTPSSRDANRGRKQT